MAMGKNRSQILGFQGSIQSDKYTDWDFLYSTTAAKDNLYNIGDRVETGDGRVFRYAYAGTGGVLSSFGAACQAIVKISHLIPAAGVAAAGVRSVLVTVGGTDGAAGNGIIATDELRGGYIVLANQSSSAMNRGIIGNSAVLTAGGTSTIYLDAPTTAAITTATYCEIMPNPYLNMRLGGALAGSLERNSFLGIPVVTAAAGQYFWLQTWGATWIVPSGTPGADQPGYASDDRDVFFVGDGSIYGGHAVTIESGYQRCGTIMQCDPTAATAGPPFVMLQISI
jgi:hypothetical protein